MTTITSSDMLPLLIGFAIAVFLFYSYVLRQESRQQENSSVLRTLLLWALRLTVAALAFAALARPAYEETRTEERLPVVPVLLDESLSMAFPASRDNPLVETNPPSQRTRYHAAETAIEKLQSRLSRTHRVQVYTFSDSTGLLKEIPHRENDTDNPLSQLEIFADHPQPTGDYSNIGDAVEMTLRDLSGDQISGMIIMSDGRQTGGVALEEIATQSAVAKVPLHTVTFGSEFTLRDLRIDETIVGAEASLGDVLTIHVKITNQISNPLETVLSLEQRGEDDAVDSFNKVTDRRVLLTRGQQTVAISMIPETEGVRRFRLSLPIEADEIDETNNVTEVTVKIVKRTLKVLLVAGEPSREYLYMVPALLRDPIIDLSCFLQSADVDYTQQGNAVVERLPQTVTEWARYDVAILFDVDPNNITTQQLAGLENMVSNGGGLMVIAGRAHGMAKLVQVHTARIRGLLPVEIDKNLHLNHDRIYDEAYRIRKTSRGHSHPIMLASADPVLNEAAWSSFGEIDFYWHHPVKSPKPKAVVLLEKTGDTPAGTSNSLMSIHRYVDGAVFFSSLNSLWRWRYPSEGYDYDRLWTRVIRYLGEARLLGTQQQVSLTTDQRSYSPGEDVEIALRVLDPALFAQLEDQQIHVSITGRDNDKYMVPMSPDTSGEPVYLGTYRARRVGDMTIQSRQAAPDADSEAKPLFDVKHGFQVRVQSLENKDTSADLVAMQTLSEHTGGRHFNYRTMSDLDSLVDAIPTDPQVLTEVETIEMWDGVTFLTIFLLLVSVELCLRKWWGLL